MTSTDPTERPKPLPVTVSMLPILRSLEQKFQDERSLLLQALNNQILIRDFATFNVLVAGMQSSIRAIDTLTGRTDVLGNPIAAPPTPATQGPPETDPAESHDAAGKRVPILKDASEAPEQHGGLND